MGNSLETICHLCLSFDTAAKKIVACPPTTLFLGCTLQFSAVKDTSVVCETSEENDSHLHVPLSSDMVMVEGLPEYATENSLRKALEKKGLPLPASLHVDDEEQVAYLQFDNTEGTKQLHTVIIQIHHIHPKFFCLLNLTLFNSS